MLFNRKLLRIVVAGLMMVSVSIFNVDASSEVENVETTRNSGSEADKLRTPFNNFNEVSGVIVDRTITRLGEDFYFFFSQKVNDKYPNLEENLTVKEIPTALSGSIIEVYHSRKAIFRTALSPGRQQAKERADDALRVVGNYIIRWQAERLFMDTYDLDHDEF